MKKDDPLQNDDDLLIQVFISIEMMRSLFLSKFSESEYFENLEFKDPYIKTLIKQSGVGNKGYVLLTLYSLLVIPKELFSDKYEETSIEFNEIAEKLFHFKESNYPEDSRGINYLRHMRNAISHGKISFQDEGSVIIFLDSRQSRKGNHKSTIKIRLKNLNPLFTFLRSVIYTHISEMQTKINTNTYPA